jgi:ABC-type sugar transport system substrate-binding protein
MQPLRILMLGACALATACADRPVQQDASGRYQLVGRCAGDAGRSDTCRDLLQQHGAKALVFAHDAELARWLAGEWREDPAGGWRLVAIGDRSPAEFLRRLEATPPAGLVDRTAVVVAEGGAAVAVDMALLCCHGIAPPPRLALGSRLLLPGGESIAQPAPGDFVVELLRRQHANLLTATPATDVVFRIGCLALRADDGTNPTADALRAAANRYPQLVVAHRTADGDPARLVEIGRELLAQGHRALLVRVDAAFDLAPLAAAAADYKAALIALDPSIACRDATCCIGSDQEALGRAAGEAVRRLAPAGAALIELAATPDSDAALAIHRGFATTLGLQQRP